jgi:hypothetical protein
MMLTGAVGDGEGVVYTAAVDVENVCSVYISAEHVTRTTVNLFTVVGVPEGTYYQSDGACVLTTSFAWRTPNQLVPPITQVGENVAPEIWPFTTSVFEYVSKTGEGPGDGAGAAFLESLKYPQLLSATVVANKVSK